ncbi:MAG: alpha/beta fold hydrolase [Anaerolineaceae bacterium]|nr:alpha/beta fold hydrolase [Anaerolineaceae bacterium]
MTFDPVSMDVPQMTGDFPARQNLISFTSHNQPLLARIQVADGIGPHPTVIFLHGYPGTEQHFDLMHALCRAGWNAVHFHYRGAWGSGGDFSFSNALEDVTAAIDFVSQTDTAATYRIDPTKLVLIGHSMGGFAALMTAPKDARIYAAASLAGFNFGIYAQALRNNPENLSNAASDWDTAPVPLRASSGQQRVNEIMHHADSWNVESYAVDLAAKPILLVAAQHDTAARPDIHHSPLVEALKKAGAKHLRAEMIDADHGFFQARITLIRTVLDWLKTV